MTRVVGGGVRCVRIDGTSDVAEVGDDGGLGERKENSSGKDVPCEDRNRMSHRVRLEGEARGRWRAEGRGTAAVVDLFPYLREFVACSFLLPHCTNTSLRL